MQLAVVQRRLRTGGVARGGEADGSREASVAAFHQMKARIAAPPRGFLAGDEDRAIFDEDANRTRVDAGQVDNDVDGLIGFEDIERRRALPGQRPEASLA